MTDDPNNDMHPLSFWDSFYNNMALIEQFDTWLFQVINLHIIHPAADDLMVSITDGSISVFICLFAAFFIVIRKKRDGLTIIILAVLAAVLADVIASGLLKPLVHRLRPCFVLAECRLLISQPNSFSFASSHAANASAAASTIWLFLRRGTVVEKTFSIIMVFYALLVAYSRIYVGVHYPSDVFAGILIGFCSATLIYILYLKIVKNAVQCIIRKDGNG